MSNQNGSAGVWRGQNESFLKKKIIPKMKIQTWKRQNGLKNSSNFFYFQEMFSRPSHFRLYLNRQWMLITFSFKFLVSSILVVEFSVYTVFVYLTKNDLESVHKIPDWKHNWAPNLPRWKNLCHFWKLLLRNCSFKYLWFLMYFYIGQRIHP